MLFVLDKTVQTNKDVIIVRICHSIWFLRR